MELIHNRCLFTDMQVSRPRGVYLYCRTDRVEDD